MSIGALSIRLLCVVVCGCLSLPKNSYGQVPLREDLLETVSFIYSYRIFDNKMEVNSGTGFHVTQKAKGLPGFLVTAKHVIMQEPGKYYPKLCIRHGTKDGPDFIPVALSGNGAARVLTHPTDAGVDIAVIPHMDIPLPLSMSDEQWLGTSVDTSLFTTKDHLAKGDVRIGNEVVFIGWFSSYLGRQRMYPLVRFGRLSLLTNEKIPWSEYGLTRMLDLYLIDALVTSGNSGSPVFFRMNIQKEPGHIILNKPTLLFAGVLKGYFQVPLSINKGPVPSNSGIAAVVPALQLKAVLSSGPAQQLQPLSEHIPPPDEKEIELCRQAERIFMSSQ